MSVHAFKNKKGNLENMKITRSLRKDWSEETRAKAFLEKILEGVIYLDDNDQPIFDDDKKEDLKKEYNKALTLNFKEKALVNFFTKDNKRIYISWNPCVFSFNEIQDEINIIKEIYEENSYPIDKMAILDALTDNLPTVEVEIANGDSFKV